MNDPQSLNELSAEWGLPAPDIEEVMYVALVRIAALRVERDSALQRVRNLEEALQEARSDLGKMHREVFRKRQGVPDDVDEKTGANAERDTP